MIASIAEQTVTQRFAATFVDELARAGLRAVCLAPGSRSAPLAMAFARHPAIRVLVHIDERCASFFALGMAKAGGRPVGLVCTSGTAAAEFFPAVLEAHHSRTPLLVMTADRPPELREVGANQAIDQTRLYGGAVRWFFDPGAPDEAGRGPARWRRLAARALAETQGVPAGPVHLNLPFREPLSPEPGHPPAPVPAAGPPLRVWSPGPSTGGPATARLLETLGEARRPLLVAGEMRGGGSLRRPLARLLRRLDAPLLAEPASQLRVAGMPGLVPEYDAMLRDPAWAAGHRPDLVVRLGAPPTSKALGQALASAPRTLVVDEAGWRDPDQVATDFYRGEPAGLLEAAASGLPVRAARWRRQWEEAGRRAAVALDRALSDSPLHEGHVVRALAAAVPSRATVMVGSSMAIRDVDSFWPGAARSQRFLGNRGASGIDGLVSTGLGVAVATGPRDPTALLLGDLSLYHDMNGLWAARRHRLRAVIVVLDNDGGGIFNFLPPAEHGDVFDELFATPLGLRLEDVARLYDFEFEAVDRAEGLPSALGRAFAGEGRALVRVRFDRGLSVSGHRACWAAVAEALRLA